MYDLFNPACLSTKVCCLNIHLLMHFFTNEEDFYFVTVHLLGPEALHLMHIIITWLVIIMSYSNDLFFLEDYLIAFGFYSAIHHNMRQLLPGIQM